jgi:flagellar biosynthesis protein FliR
MSFLDAVTIDRLLLFTLVLARVAALLATAPLFGAVAAPLHVRALLAVMLALLVLPLQWGTTLPLPGNWLSYAILLGNEVVIGACLGLGVAILVYAMGLAGELIGAASGLTLSDIVDPSTGESIPHFSRLMTLATVCVFLCIGGHRMVMAGLLDTFRTIPPGSCVNPHALVDAFTTLVAESFSLGIRAAAPAVTALLLATVALGLIGRTLPQLNLFAIGFGINTMLAFAVTGLVLGTAAWAFQAEVGAALQTILDALHTRARPEWLL